MGIKIHLHVITSDDCFACRGCCTFDARYTDYAPLFTDAQREKILAELPDDDIRFSPVGRLWRVVLRAPSAAGRCACPLLADDGWRCRVYDSGIFDCDTWPYQVQARGGRRLLTITRECPVVGEDRLAAMRRRGEELLPLIQAEIERHPERIMPDYDDVVVLADLGPA